MYRRWIDHHDVKLELTMFYKEGDPCLCLNTATCMYHLTGLVHTHIIYRRLPVCTKGSTCKLITEFITCLVLLQ